MNLQELLQKRADIIDKQRALINLADSEKRDLTGEEENLFNDLESDIIKLDKRISLEDKLSAREEDPNQSVTRAYRPDPGPVLDKKDDAGFANLGEFISAVRFGDSRGRVQNLKIGQGQGGGVEVPEAFKASFMPRFRSEWSTTGANGGFAIPATQFRPEILMLQPEPSIVRQRATVIPPGDPPDGTVTMPAFNQGANGVFGGVEVFWIAEGAAKPETDGELREVSLTPKEVAAHTVVTDKLLRNWEAANTFISTLLLRAITAAEDFAFLRGNGVGKPMSVMNTPGSIAVNRIAAGQIGYIDAINMLARLLPESQDSAIWIASQSILPEIATMQDPGGRYIFIQGDATRGVPATLAGIPIKFTGKSPTLGNRGDLMLLDFAHYLIKDGSGPFIAASEHVLFRQNKTVIKVFWNVDGQSWIKEPLTLEDGVTTVSPFVLLI